LIDCSVYSCSSSAEEDLDALHVACYLTLSFYYNYNHWHIIIEVIARISYYYYYYYYLLILQGDVMQQQSRRRLPSLHAIGRSRCVDLEDTPSEPAWLTPLPASDRYGDKLDDEEQEETAVPPSTRYHAYRDLTASRNFNFEKNYSFLKIFFTFKPLWPPRAERAFATGKSACLSALPCYTQGVK